MVADIWWMEWVDLDAPVPEIELPKGQNGAFLAACEIPKEWARVKDRKDEETTPEDDLEWAACHAAVVDVDLSKSPSRRAVFFLNMARIEPTKFFDVYMRYRLPKAGVDSGGRFSDDGRQLGDLIAKLRTLGPPRD